METSGSATSESLGKVAVCPGTGVGEHQGMGENAIHACVPEKSHSSDGTLEDPSQELLKPPPCSQTRS